MKPDYKNWVPKNMLYLLAFFTLVSCIITFLLMGLLQTGAIKTILISFFLLSSIVLAIALIWMIRMYNAFSYDGKRKLSKEIINGIVNYIEVENDALVLDVGCGSGALTIAIAKRYPSAKIIGIDRWGKEYGSYNKKLCENNAKAENVNNVEFKKGDAVKLDFSDEYFDVVTSNYVYHNITGINRQKLLLETLRVLKKGGIFVIHDIFSESKYGDIHIFINKLKKMGYEDVQLIDTSNGMFMSKKEAIMYSINNSAILYGKK